MAASPPSRRCRAVRSSDDAAGRRPRPAAHRRRRHHGADPRPPHRRDARMPRRRLRRQRPDADRPRARARSRSSTTRPTSAAPSRVTERHPPRRRLLAPVVHQVLESMRNSRFGGIPVLGRPALLRDHPRPREAERDRRRPAARPAQRAPLPRARAYQARPRRALASAGLLILLSPPDPRRRRSASRRPRRGPVFFGQQRTGHNGKIFRMWKFRTMVQDAEGFRMGLAHLNEMGESDAALQDPPRPARDRASDACSGATRSTSCRSS